MDESTRNSERPVPVGPAVLVEPTGVGESSATQPTRAGLGQSYAYPEMAGPHAAVAQRAIDDAHWVTSADRRLLTAAELRSDRMLQPRATPPAQGWRRAVFMLTGGAVNVGPGIAELRERQRISRIRTRVTGCRRIAVISRKGGIGKTTTVLMLGHMLASARGDRVIALDANPDAGSLADRVVRETHATVTDVLREGPHLIHYADVRGFTSQAPSRLEVLASNNDPHITEALGEDDYARAMDVLGRFYSIAICDTGTGILHSATRGVLKLADQLVLCTSASIDGSRVSASTLDWLVANGYERLAGEAVVVLNAVRPTGLLQLDVLEGHFRRRCRALVRIPWDARLAAGAETNLDELNPATQMAYQELAALVAEGFSNAGHGGWP